jgi:hypothetical protein
MSLLPEVRRAPAVGLRAITRGGTKKDEPRRNGTSRQEGERFPERRRHASVGPVVNETRGNLGAAYARPSVLRRPVFEGRPKAARAAPPD